MRWLVAVLLMVSLAGCAEGAETVTEDVSQSDPAPVENSTSTPEVGELRLLVAANVTNGTAPLNVSLDIDVLNATEPVAWTVEGNGTLANGTGVPAVARFQLPAGLHVVTVRAAGLEHVLEFNVSAVADIPIADFTTYPGMRVPLDAGEGACAWSIPDALEIGDEASCQTHVRFASVGTFPVTLSVDGTSKTIQVTAVFPEPQDRVAGSLYMYNMGAAGGSNIVAIGAGEWHYVTGDTVSVQGRGMGGDLAGIADGAEYFILDPEGTIVAGPLDAGSGGGADWSGASLGITKAGFPDNGGRYYLGAVAYMPEGPIWVKDTNDGRSGFKGFLVHHAA